MTIDIRPFSRPGWDPLPRDGVVGVDGRVLVQVDEFFVAQLRFSRHATIDEHAGERDTIVLCIEGAGFTSVAGESVPLREGQQVLWPQGVAHRLWTEDSTMMTLMIERLE